MILAGLLLFLAGCLYVQNWLQAHLDYHPAHWLLLVFGSFIYLFSMSIPFVPGIELGLMLMMIFGLPGILVVYVVTQLALNLAYHGGRYFNQRLEQRFHEGLEKAPKRLRFVAQYMQRYPALIFLVLLNLPGNAVIGGAGGIAALYGILRVLSPGRFCLVALLATLPVPLSLLLGLLWGKMP